MLTLAYISFEYLFALVHLLLLLHPFLYVTFQNLLKSSENINPLKVVSATFLQVCFLYLKQSTCETRKNVFYFTSKAFFVLEIIKF